LAPPKSDHPAEGGPHQSVSRRMTLGQRAPASVLHRPQRSVFRRFERDLDERLLLRLEIDASPFESQPRRRLPGSDAADLDGPRAGGQLECFEQPSPNPALETERPAPPATDSVAGTVFPPKVDLAREHVERVLLFHVDMNGHGGAITRRGSAV